MKIKKMWAVLLACVSVLALLSGCAGNTGAVGGTIAAVDMAEREIRLKAPASKIVVVSPSDCEILCAIGAGDALVGRGEYCDYPAEVQDLPVIKSGEELNIEEVMALAPDVIVMPIMAQTKEQVAALEEAGTAVVVSNAQDISGVYTAIGLLGAISGQADEAEKLVAEMKQTFADVQAKAEAGGKTIYFEVSPLEYGLWTSGAHTFMDEIAALLKLENAFADVDGWGQISEEQVIERDPDYIVTTAMYFGEGPTPEEEIRGRAGWEGLKAVQNKHVFQIGSDEITRPGPRLAAAVETLYERIYGFASASAAA